MFFFRKTQIYLLIVVATLNLRCGCETALCDLITGFAIQGVISITSGVPFGIPNAIDNTLEAFESCRNEILKTRDANASQSRMRIDFDDEESGSYDQNEVNSNFDVDPISAGGRATENYVYSFNDPGFYRLITSCDVSDTNQERDEENNDSSPLFVPAGKSINGQQAYQNKPLIIHVLPNPNFKRKPGQPRVELISRTVTYSK